MMDCFKETKNSNNEQDSSCIIDTISAMCHEEETYLADDYLFQSQPGTSAAKNGLINKLAKATGGHDFAVWIHLGK